MERQRTRFRSGSQLDNQNGPGSQPLQEAGSLTPTDDHLSTSRPRQIEERCRGVEELLLSGTQRQTDHGPSFRGKGLGQRGLRETPARVLEERTRHLPGVESSRVQVVAVLHQNEKPGAKGNRASQPAKERGPLTLDELRFVPHCPGDMRGLLATRLGREALTVPAQLTGGQGVPPKVPERLLDGQGAAGALHIELGNRVCEDDIDGPETGKGLGLAAQQQCRLAQPDFCGERGVEIEVMHPVQLLARQLLKSRY